MYMQTEQKIEYERDDIGKPIFLAEKDNFYSNLLEKLHRNHKDLTRFEQYLLVKLKRGVQTQEPIQKIPHKTSLPKKFEVAPTSDSYAGALGINSSEANFGQPSFNSRNWSRTHAKRKSFEPSSVKIALGNFELPIQSTEVTKQTMPYQFQSTKTDGRTHENFTSLTAESPKEELAMITKIHTQSDMPDRGGVRTSIGARRTELSELNGEISKTNRRNKSANQPHRKIPRLNTQKKPKVKADLDSLNDSEIEKHLNFIKSLEQNLEQNELVDEPIDQKIKEKLETPEQEQLFLHLRRTLYRPNTSAPQSRLRTRGTTPIRTQQPSANISVEMEAALRNISDGTRLPSAQRSTKRETNRQEEDPLELRALPGWIKRRQEFRRDYSKKKDDTKSIVAMICEKSTFDRSYDDKIVIVSWLNRVAMFKSLPSVIHQEIASKLNVKYYNEGDIICKQGQEGDCLYIIYDGIVDVYVNGVQVAGYKSGEALGRQSLENAAPRNATLMAKTNCSILILGRPDYQAIMIRFISQEKQEYLSFLRSLKFFKDLNEAKLAVLSSLLLGKFYYKGDSTNYLEEFALIRLAFYKRGDQPETFYIIKEGKVNIETNVEIEKSNRWPIGLNQWKVKKTVRTVLYTTTLEEGSFFGEIEIIRKIPRLNKLVALTDCYILSVNANKFFEIFESEDIRKLKLIAETRAVMNKDVMQESIINEEKNRRQMANVIIEALNNNMRNKTDYQLEKYQERKVIPHTNFAKKKLNEYIKQTTLKIEEGEEIINNIID